MATSQPASPSSALLQALSHPLSDRRLEVLRSIGACGSISQAARQVGVSYKAAWQALDTLTNLAGQPLVDKSVGGAGGGGARLTEAGHALLQAAAAMAQAKGQWWSQRSVGAAALPDALPATSLQPTATGAAHHTVVQRLALQTSMRNQWPCVVQQVQIAGPLARVHLQVQSTEAAQATSPWSVVARITSESAELLGLEPGLPVLALCKATAVRVYPAAAVPAASAAEASVNQWAGKATRVTPGDLADEVAAVLPNGVHLVGFATPGGGWRAGRRVHVVVPESAVVLALV